MNYDRLLIRVWDKQEKKMLYIGDYIKAGDRYSSTGNDAVLKGFTVGGMITTDGDNILYGDRFIPMQCTGLKDKNDKLMYEGDVCIFKNGDKFYIDCEDYGLELFVNWIGEPKCEDQTRDFYRLENSKIIGNIYECPELLEVKDDRK